MKMQASLAVTLLVMLVGVGESMSTVFFPLKLFYKLTSFDNEGESDQKHDDRRKSEDGPSGPRQGKMGKPKTKRTTQRQPPTV